MLERYGLGKSRGEGVERKVGGEKKKNNTTLSDLVALNVYIDD